jgi:hypothetical protein
MEYISTTVFGRKTTASLQTTLVADARLTEGQFLLTEQTLNIGKSRIYLTGTRRPRISKAEWQSVYPR